MTFDIRFERLDGIGDRLLEPLRNHRVFVAIFGAASTIGDFSIIWHVAGLLRAIGSVHRLGQALALSVVLGVESLVVNQGIKRLFPRQRPTVSGDDRFEVRTPRTSSFPSGHASSAVCAAIVLTTFTGWPVGVLWAVVAAIVALSRAVVRIHHISDVLGGLFCGALIGALALPFVHNFS
ncbi:MAG: phosphatase PAP2 family protein [Ilumatobacteraceae bacterium]|nr:phosphatase PAP2 family protein [Ilumatobacteraceae bacterium]